MLWRCEVLLQEEKRSGQDGGDHWIEKLTSFNRVQQNWEKVVLEKRVVDVVEKQGSDDIGDQGVPNRARLIHILNRSLLSLPTKIDSTAMSSHAYKSSVNVH